MARGRARAQRDGISLGAMAAAALVVALSGIGACGDDGGTAAPREDASASVDAAGSDAAATDAGPVRAAFGLDSRPANATCKAPSRPPPSGPVVLERVFGDVDISLMTVMAQIPGDKTRWFVASQDGKIRSFPTLNPPADPPVVLDLALLTGLPLNMEGEGGLIGFAFHPQFAQNGRIFVSWTTDPIAPGAVMSSLVSRFTSTDQGATFGQHTVVVPRFDQPYVNHKGGGLAFGADGYLYLAFGDGGGSDPPPSKSTVFSKILRIDVDAAPPPGATFVVPPDNPFVGVAGAEPAAFAYGFRNPYRISVDRATNELWTGDVGQGKWEEIDRVMPGGNYGWPCREGAHDFITTAECGGAQGFLDPIVEHEHVDGVSPYRAITGGHVYRGKAMPGLVGTYVYGDFGTGEVFGLTIDPVSGAAVSTLLNPSGPKELWTGFAEDGDGEIYVHSFTYNAIWKLVPAAAAPPSTFPDRLSKTGCVDAARPKQPAPGLVPYTVNAALWSDGAEKERFLALPDGATIAVKDDGDFDPPAGTVLMKTFSVAGRRIETRLLVRHADAEWSGYSYAWLDDESDALLLPAGKTQKVGAQTWVFPSRGDCARCHTAAAGRTLGLELGQLNGDLVYPSTNRIANQLATLEHIGMLEKPLGKPVGAIVRYPSLTESAPLEARARAYLHANCSGCHRPTGPTRSDMDLRFGTALGATATCGKPPRTDDLGVAAATLLAPGAPEKSLLSLRVHARGAARMPPLASTVVDAAGAKVLDDWIRSVAACSP